MLQLITLAWCLAKATLCKRFALTRTPSQNRIFPLFVSKLPFCLLQLLCTAISKPSVTNVFRIRLLTSHKCKVKQVHKNSWPSYNMYIKSSTDGLKILTWKYRPTGVYKRDKYLFSTSVLILHISFYYRFFLNYMVLIL